MGGGNFSRINTRTAGNTISGSDDDADFDNIIANMSPEGAGGTSDNVAAMQAETDPYPGGSESLATSTAGELHRLRFVFKQQHITSEWYIFPDLVSKTAAYTATQDDRVILNDATGGAYSVTLPAVSGLTDKFFYIKKTDSSANAVTIDGNASEEIDGVTTLALTAQNDSVLIGCNGSAWFVLASTIAPSTNIVALRDNARGLVIIRPTTDTIDIDADEIILQDAGAVAKRVSSVDLTADISGAPGINSIDTGAEASSTWYHLWVINDGTTTASLISLSSTAPTMPSGYTFKALVGATYNDGSSNLIDFTQAGNKVEYIANQTIKNASFTTTTWTAQSIAAFAPPTAELVRIGMAGTSAMAVSPRSDGEQGYYTNAAGGTSTTFDGVFPTSRARMDTAEIDYASSIYYWVTTSNATLIALGFTLK